MLGKLAILKDTLHKINIILTEKQKKQSISAFVSIIISSILELLGVTIIVPFITAVMDPQIIMQSKYFLYIVNILHIQNPSSSITLVLLGILLMLVYITKNVGLIYSRYIQNAYQNNIQKDISVMMMSSYLNHPYEYFVNTNIAEMYRGVGGDVFGFINIINVLLTCLAELLTAGMILCFILTMDFLTSIGLILIASLCIVIIVFGCKNITARIGVRQREATLEQSKCTGQTFNGIKDIFVMQRKGFFLNAYEKASEKQVGVQKIYLLILSIPERIIEVLVVCGIVAIVCVRILQGYAAEAYISQLAAVAIACFRLLPTLNKLTGGASQLIYNMPCLNSVYNNIIEAREYVSRDNIMTESALNDNAKPLTFNKDIEIRNITWQYSNTDRNVLEHLSLKIYKGESVALIGESGAGKSTLADVIMGLLEPQQGEILVDGQPIHQNLFQWSKLIGYVPQSVYLTDDTIRNNVAFGIPEEEINDENVWDALKQARLDEYIYGLPNGLDTIVGERGIKFSGGQRQRIAIARTMYYDPEILVLDEATSALDDETEKAVMESIDSLQGHKTLIIIAHRLSTIQKCDKIYEVVDKKIIERAKSDIFHTSD